MEARWSYAKQYVGSAIRTLEVSNDIITLAKLDLQAMNSRTTLATDPER